MFTKKFYLLSSFFLLLFAFTQPVWANGAGGNRKSFTSKQIISEPLVCTRTADVKCEENPTSITLSQLCQGTNIDSNAT